MGRDPSATKKFSGLAASPGLAAGPLFVLRRDGGAPVPRYVLRKNAVPAEIARLDAAVALTRTQLQSLAAELSQRISGEEAGILDGHLMMLQDPQFLGDCKEAVSTNLLNAEAAVSDVVRRYSDIFSAMDDPYLRERGKDVADLARRLVDNLLGSQAGALPLPERPCIIAADELSPTETISLPKSLVLGFATDRGSMTSHATLLARALGIPAVVGLGEFSSSVRPGDEILLDGDSGAVVLSPSKEEKQAFARLQAKARNLRAANSVADGPCETADGHPVPLLANIDPSTPLSDLTTSGAQGVGLYRTEYLWLVSRREPSEEEQEHVYTQVLRSLPPGQSATVRVFDLGGDKVLPELAKSEANPFLGNRSIRFLLSHTEVFRLQLRALLKASAHGDLRILYPMIATVEELRAANSLLEKCKSELRKEGAAFREDIQRGVMIELPAAALIADALAAEADFFSVGTNDLVQYTLAVDRSNETVAGLYQPAHPAVLRLIAMATEAAHKRGIPIGVCGEAASDPVMACLFAGMGVDSLSMSPAVLPPVRRSLKQFHFSVLEKTVQSFTTKSGLTAGKVYSLCKEALEKSKGATGAEGV